MDIKERAKVIRTEKEGDKYFMYFQDCLGGVYRAEIGERTFKRWKDPNTDRLTKYNIHRQALLASVAHMKQKRYVFSGVNASGTTTVFANGFPNAIVLALAILVEEGKEWKNGVVTRVVVGDEGEECYHVKVRTDGLGVHAQLGERVW